MSDLFAFSTLVVMDGLSSFWSWWYGPGFRRATLVVRAYAHNTIDTFSVAMLLRTIFAPWKKDEQSGKGLGLNEKLQVVLMNLIARLVGAVVRSMLIVVAGIMVAGEYLLGGIYLLGWLAFPLLIIYLIVHGFILVLLG